jgi:hypothetical protein
MCSRTSTPFLTPEFSKRSKKLSASVLVNPIVVTQVLAINLLVRGHSLKMT